MKKFIFLTVVVLSAVIFTSCGDKKSDATSNSAQSTSTANVAASNAGLKSELTAKKGEKPIDASSSKQAPSSATSSASSRQVAPFGAVKDASSLVSTSSSQPEKKDDKASNSTPEKSPASSSPNSASTSGSTSVAQTPKQEVKPEAKAQELATPNAEDWPSTFATITPKNGGGVQLFVLKTPKDWRFDSLSVYSKNKIKTCEILSVTKNLNANSFPNDLLTKYNVEQAQPGDYGLVEKTDGTLGEHKFRSYLFFAKPLDAQTEYHVYFCLVNVNGYTLEMAFYTSDATGEKVVPIINEVIENIKYIDVYNYKKTE